MGISQKDRIKNFEKVEKITIDGEDFYVRYLRSFEKSRLLDEELTFSEIFDNAKKEGKELSPKESIGMSSRHSDLKFILYCADETGKRLFSDTEANDVCGFSDVIRNAIIEKGDELNFSKERERIKAAKKDLGEAPKNIDGTPSPAISESGT